MDALKTLLSPRTTNARGGGATQRIPASHTGWLHKRGETNTAFKHRYFVLRGRTLSYYDGETASTAKGEVVLLGATCEPVEPSRRAPERNLEACSCM